MEPEAKANKGIIKEIIYHEITTNKNDLVAVKTFIENKFQLSLNPIDSAYIEVKYIKHCFKAWLLEIKDTFRNLTDSKNRGISEISSSLCNIQNLSQVSNIFKQLDHYKLLIKNLNNCKYISKEFEKTLVNLFKKEFLKQLVSYNEAAEEELIFLKTLGDFLSGAKNVRSIKAFHLFCHDNLSFRDFLDQIVNLEVDGENLLGLQEAAECLKREKCFFFLDSLKEMVKAYLKPIELRTTTLEDRLVVEVVGSNVSLGEVLVDLEKVLSENPAVEEVRFVAAATLHVDADLASETWRGKNVAVLAKVVKVAADERGVVWNVSGKDNNARVHSMSDAGTAEDGRGRRGADGGPGESGGNVLVLADEVVNAGNLFVVSNGGKGGRGQDGGSGRNGEDGRSIAWKEFSEYPPHRFIFMYGFIKFVPIILRKIIRETSTAKTVWFRDRDIHSMRDIERSIGSNSLGDIFIEAVTHRGNEIVFSKYLNVFGLTQIFLLCKGSPGQEGCSGGRGGCGGGGGLSGQITVTNIRSHQKLEIQTETREGDNGAHGSEGSHGRHGVNGLDMGYVNNKAFWQSLSEDSKLELRYDNVSVSDYSVWCSYKEKYATIVPCESRHGNRVTYAERDVGRQNVNRQYTPAESKKSVSKPAILDRYSHHLSFAGHNSKSVISLISKAVVWSERAVHINDIVKITGKFLDKIHSKIKDELRSNPDENVRRDEMQEQDYEEFRKEIIELWKLLLREKAGRMIAQNVVSPVLKESANCMLRHLGKRIQEGYRLYKESEYERRFEELKLSEASRNAAGQESNINPQGRNPLTNQYHKELLKLMKKTRNPRLFAAIVRENVPMDFTCVDACAQAAFRILSEQGIAVPALTIEVEGEGCVKQSFSAGLEGATTGKKVTLQLRNNHFQLDGRGAPGSHEEVGGRNDCLIDALNEEIPELNNCLTREMVAHFIEHCPDMHRTILEGWQRLPLDMGAFGGASSRRRRNSNARGNSSNGTIDGLISKRLEESYEHARWKATDKDHVGLIVDRKLTDEETHAQLTKGFNVALDRIGQSLSKTTGRPVSLDPSMLTATQHDTIICSSAFGRSSLAGYPVEMIGEVQLRSADRVLKTYKFEINLDNPASCSSLEGPHGPHIGYKVLNEGDKVTGHILLNRNTNLPDRRLGSQTTVDVPKIPPTRLFFQRNRPSTALVRVGQIDHSFVRTLENRSFPSPHF